MRIYRFDMWTIQPRWIERFCRQFGYRHHLSINQEAWVLYPEPTVVSDLSATVDAVTEILP